MDYNDSLEKIKKFEKILSTYKNEINSFIENYETRDEIDKISSAKFKKEFESNISNKNSLNIGIIGTVKAGKSSLLNALFFRGGDILPTAATPMTASLTVITYGETNRAEVEFYNQEDLHEIRQRYDDYNRQFVNLKEKEIQKQLAGGKSQDEAEKIAVKYARDTLSSKTTLCTSHQQYELMIKSSMLPDFEKSKYTEHSEITSDNVHDLKLKLQDYVGSSGKFMPFTKAVTLYINEQNIKGIKIIDTPGLDDPVKSRSKRTEEYLGLCDVIFLISHSGRFYSAADSELLNKMITVNGVEEINLIASRSDESLRSDIDNDDEDQNDNLNYKIKQLNKVLMRHAKQIFTGKDEDGNSFKDLYITNDDSSESYKDKTFIVSSMCHSLACRFSEPDSWSDEMKHCFSQLKQYFPDYISDSPETADILFKISNIAAVQDKLNKIRQEKQLIIQERIDDWSSATEETIKNIKKELIEYCRKRLNYLTQNDLTILTRKKDKLESLKNKLSSSINNAYNETTENLKISSKNEIQKHLNIVLSRVSNDVESQKGIEQYESYTTRPFLIFFTKKVPCIRTQATVNAAATRRILYRMIYDVTVNLSEMLLKFKKEWKRNTFSEINRIIAKLNTEDLDYFDLDIIPSAINSRISKFEIPDINFNTLKPEQLVPELNSTDGIIRGDSAVNNYSEKIDLYLQKFQEDYLSITNEYLKSMIKAIDERNFSGILFSDLDRIILEEEKNFNNLQQCRHNLESCIEEASGI